MNYTVVFDVLQKGLTLLPILISAGTNVIALIERMRNVAAAAKEGKQVDPAELAALEADLDAALAEFNSDLPEA